MLRSATKPGPSSKRPGDTSTDQHYGPTHLRGKRGTRRQASRLRPVSNEENENDSRTFLSSRRSPEMVERLARITFMANHGQSAFEENFIKPKHGRATLFCYAAPVLIFRLHHQTLKIARGENTSQYNSNKPEHD
ncbi:hypothetical protein EVAR_43465_1 [Eumeta japonica]|uniref:Uncharacterized protein n=1 Tax=Eumeta variegata TaxID=151549 RepID=A0A4C1Z5C3_EUMVA|nr:hypothetical protein EVAR_43465_1 [Eumeta japonica]